jgi:hypothetical protein
MGHSSHRQPDARVIIAIPMTLEELMRHADYPEIWAMVVEMRAVAYEAGYDDGWYDSLAGYGGPSWRAVRLHP